MTSFLAKIPLSIYPKLVITFLIVLIPLYTWSLRMNESSADIVREEITKSMLSRVHFYLNALEVDFNRIIRLQQEYASDEDLIKLNSFYPIIDDIDKSNAINRLRSRLNLLQSSSPYIRNVQISIASMNRTISTDQTINPIDPEVFSQLSKSTNRFESPFLSFQERLYISVPYPEIAASNGPQFIIGVEVDKREIQSSIGLFAENLQGGAVMIDGQKRWYIANVPNTNLESPLIGLAHEWMETSTELSGIRSMRYEDQTYIVTFEKSKRLDATLLTYVPETEVLGPLQKFRSGIWWLSLVSLIIIVLFSYSIYQLIHQPLRNLVRGFKKVEIGNLDGEIQYKYRDEFSYLYKQFNKMIERLKVLIHEVYEQKYRIRLSELRQLQLQIDPHFLYNSFFILYRMAKMEETEQVMKFTKCLGNYYQFITYDGVQEVPLKDEINFVRSYVEIQNFRFGRFIEVDFPDLPEAWSQILVPRLIVQPLLENCYKHGLADEDEAGKIKVSYTESQPEQMLQITVEDSGALLDAGQLGQLQQMMNTYDEQTEMRGLYNVHRRLRIRYKELGGLRISRSQLGGLKVELMIPIDMRQDLNEVDKEGTEHV